jgi:hypothetical protein
MDIGAVGIVLLLAPAFLLTETANVSTAANKSFIGRRKIRPFDRCVGERREGVAPFRPNTATERSSLND